jgi:predicted nucleotidyltransferase
MGSGMRTTLPRLARELETTDRTLRRAVDQGLLRIQRPSPRTVELPLDEHVYLRKNWPLLAELRQILRTEPGISLAVLFGSRARGDNHAHSDVDLLVALRPDAKSGATERRRSRALSARLSERLGLDVQVIPLRDAEDSAVLLAEVIRDGRVLVDRGGEWSRLVERRNRVNHAATRERKELNQRFERFVMDNFAA